MKTLRVRRAISGFLGDDEARVERVLELVENQSKNLHLGVYPPHYFLGWRYRLDVVEAEGAGCIVLRNRSALELHTRPGWGRQAARAASAPLDASPLAHETWAY